MLDWLKSYWAPEKQKIDWKAIYLGPNDLPSLGEIIEKHIDMLKNQAEGKYIKTTDEKSLSIVQKMFEENKFIKQHILNCPSNNSNETQSLKVKICNINKYPHIKKTYEEWKQTGKNRIIAIGGPSAHDQTILASMIPEIKRTHDIHFYCRNYLETNVLHSALQSHARHGNALNADPILSGRHLLPLIFKRLIFGVPLEEVIKRDFIKIDVKLNNLAYILEYVKNQINGIKQLWLSWRGKFNEHDCNRFESVISQQIQRVMQKTTCSSFTSRIQKNKDSQTMAIHLVFTQNQLKDMHKEHHEHEKVEGIKIKEVSKAELKELFPQSEPILAGWRYIGDYATKVDTYETQKQKAQQMGAIWKQNKTLSKVYVGKDSKGPYACGVEFTDGEFIPADKIHLTLGYRAGYFFEGTNKRAVKNINIPVAGVSTNFLLQKTPNLKKIIDQKGSLQLEITSNNWTIAGHDDKCILLRGTAGGNTGSETYQPSHFLNLCRNTRSIFGDALIGIISVYGCPRAVNYKNSTEFCKLANGLVISYGKGGTGNTKRAAEAYKALSYLGLGKEVNQYFKTLTGLRVNIVNGMAKVLQKSSEVGFYYDWSNETKNNLFNLIF